MSLTTLTITQQIIAMFFIIALGYILNKQNIITSAVTTSLSSILINITLPISIFLSFLKPFQIMEAKNLFLSFLLAIAAHAIFILVAMLFFKNPIHKNIVALPNCGFMGLPLVSAIVGEYAIFYVSAYMAVNSIAQWTYGYHALAPHQKISFISWLKTPITIVILLSILVYTLSIPIPTIITIPLTYLGSMNTPLAMLVLGSFLASSNIKEHLKDYQSYAIILTRLIILPLIIIVLGLLLPQELSLLRQIILILSATPAAISVALFSEKAKADTQRASVLICLSTLASLITIPIILEVASLFWGSL